MSRDDLAARRRLREDYEALGKAHPALKDPDRQARTTQYLEDQAAMENKAPRGRPSKGVAKYRQVAIYLPPDMVEALDIAVDRRERKTGHHCNRTDIIREALAAWLAGPPAPADSTTAPGLTMTELARLADKIEADPQAGDTRDDLIAKIKRAIGR